MDECVSGKEGQTEGSLQDAHGPVSKLKTTETFCSRESASDIRVWNGKANRLGELKRESK